MTGVEKKEFLLALVNGDELDPNPAVRWINFGKPLVAFYKAWVELLPKVDDGQVVTKKYIIATYRSVFSDAPLGAQPLTHITGAQWEAMGRYIDKNNPRKPQHLPLKEEAIA